MWTALRSVVIWTVIALITVVMFFLALPGLVSLPFDRKRAYGHAVATAWARTVRWIHPAWGLTRVGVEHARGGPFVIVANHESTIDIAALYQLPLNFKWISKHTNFRLPLLGWFMSAAGYIPLVRGNKDSIARCMAVSERWLRTGVSVAFFPEGTRSHDGNLLPFKLGAFRLAIRTGAPILPITLVGTRDVLPKGEWRIPARVDSVVCVDPPIPTVGLRQDDAGELAARVREVIAARKRAQGGAADSRSVQAVSARAAS